MIVLYSDKLEVTKIIKKTQARFFKDVRVGDLIEANLVLKAPGRTYRGTYATRLTVSNYRTKKTAVFSLANLSKQMNLLEFRDDVELLPGDDSQIRR